jgi:hypothetical protein
MTILWEALRTRGVHPEFSSDTEFDDEVDSTDKQTPTVRSANDRTDD